MYTEMSAYIQQIKTAIYSTYHVPDTGLSTLHILFSYHNNLELGTIIIPFYNEESEAQRGSVL